MSMSTKLPNPSLPESEWFVPFRADSIAGKAKKMSIAANAGQCAAIATRLDINAVKNLAADIVLHLENGGHILHITGHFKADVVQDCVTTLEPIESTYEDDFEAWYADHDKAVPFSRAKHQVKASEEGDEVQMLEEKDDPEAMIDGQVDLGEIVIQFLSLAINPYPRKDGVADDVPAEITIGPKIATTLRPNPFAALKNWRPKD